MGFVDDEEVLAASPRTSSSTSTRASGRCGGSSACTTPSPATTPSSPSARRSATPDCLIPTCGLDWVTTPQPSCWSSGRSPQAASAIHQRRQLARPLRAGRVRGPTLRPARARVAQADRSCRRWSRPSSSWRSTSTRPTRADLEALRANGWALADPPRSAGDPEAYRRYIQGSLGELMVAKGMYVETRSGWFSERSVCYLASGRPVLGPGHRLRRALPDRRGPARLRRPRRAPATAIEAVCARLGAPLRAPPARSPRSTSRRRRCCGRLLEEVARGEAAQLGLRRARRSPAGSTPTSRTNPASTSLPTSARACRWRATASTTRSASTPSPRSPIRSSCRRWRSCAGC